MLKITETPVNGRATTWTALDAADLVSRVREAHERAFTGLTLYEKTTKAELWDSFDADNDEDAAEWLRQMPEGDLYRCDYLRDGYGCYSIMPISEYDACIAYLRHDLRALEVSEVNDDE